MIEVGVQNLFWTFLFLVISLGANAEPVTKDLCLPWNPCNDDSSIRARLDRLSSPEPSCTVTFWLNSPGKTHFTTADEVIISYKVSGLDKPVYLTLFNISPADKLWTLIDNQAIEVGRVYTYPEKSRDLAIGQLMTGLGLDAGREYFKVIVTSREIPYTQWFSLMDAKNPRQLSSVLCVQSLVVDVI